MVKKLTLAGWLLVSTILFLYSFTQVDLGLTLTKASVFQGIEKSFQYIGYFNRGLSSVIFVLIVLMLFILYFITLHLVNHRSYKRREVWAIIISVGVILFLAYNAFSYDLFNYIFDAKIVTFYHQNPYTHGAIDFPHDKMLGFMHWTQRTYPYGPFWLVITVPLSYIGVNYFLLTFYLFKLLALVSFLGVSYFIEKILQKIKTVDSLFGLVFFALNPLVLVEFLVSAHNDITMMFFAMLSAYLLIQKRFIWASIFLLISIGIKFATVFLIPPYIIFFYFLFYRKRTEYPLILEIAAACMIIPVILATVRTNFQPWYLLYILPFASLLSKKFYVAIPTIVITFVSLFTYLPFLFEGNWNPPIPLILWWMMFLAVAVSCALVLFYYLRNVHMHDYFVRK